MADKVIITAALSGAGTYKNNNPNVPYTAQEFAEESNKCLKAGAAMVHVHARLDDGTPTHEVDKIRATYDALCRQLDWPHTTLCYQSRVGPLKWLQPYIQDVLREKARARARQVLVYPIAFVSDHVETLSELGIEYAQLARELGIGEYRVAPALNAHPLLIAALKQLVLARLHDA